MSNKIQTLIKKLKKFGYHVFKPKIIDVVCNMKIQEGFIFSEYNGQTYSFCSEHCKTQFEANPTQWTAYKGDGAEDKIDDTSVKQLETKDSDNKHKNGGCCH